MTTVGRPRRYRIILRGECGPLMAAVLDGLLIESYQGWTCVTALVDEIVGALVTLLPTVGPARVSAFAAATLEASSA